MVGISSRIDQVHCLIEIARELEITIRKASVFIWFEGMQQQ